MAAAATRRFVFGLALAFPFVGGGARQVAARCPKPPRLSLRVGGRRQRGRRGTFCWSDARGGCCVDMGGAFFPSDALYAALGETPVLDASALGPIAALSYEIRPTRIVVDADGLGWSDARGPAPVHEARVERPSAAIPLPDDLPHGMYLIDVFVEALGGGDTQQGFRLYVAAARPPGEGAATPAAVAQEAAADAVACPPQPGTLGYQDVPRLELVGAAGCQLAGLGSYCWGDAGCGEASGISHPRFPLVLGAGDAAQLRADPLGMPVRLRWGIVPDPGAGAYIDPDPRGTMAVAKGRLAPSTGPALLPADLPAGEYVVNVQVEAIDRPGHSAEQGFRIRVEAGGAAGAPPDASPQALPPAPAATPVAVATSAPREDEG
jgi:hypothetical protein